MLNTGSRRPTPLFDASFYGLRASDPEVDRFVQRESSPIVAKVTSLGHKYFWSLVQRSTATAKPASRVFGHGQPCFGLRQTLADCSHKSVPQGLDGAI